MNNTNPTKNENKTNTKNGHELGDPRCKSFYLFNQTSRFEHIYKPIIVIFGVRERKRILSY